jgi:hypothetical protein
MSFGGAPGVVGFTPEAGARVAIATREVERRMRNPRGRRQRWLQPIRREIVFELKTILEPASDITATAYVCTWDTSANSGDGGFVAGTTEVTVVTPERDAWGIPGEQGRARPMRADNGIRYLIIENPGADHYYGKLDGNLAVDSSATFSIWTGDPRTDSTHNVTVYSPPLQSSQIDSGDWMRIQFSPDRGGKAEGEGAPCE